MRILESAQQINIADSLDKEQLTKIGEEVCRGYDTDLDSRKQWEADLEEWTKLAIQVREKKDFPWEKASNVKYPLLSTAAMQFTARAYPIIVPSDAKVVKCRVIGPDPSGIKAGRAKRVSEHMSYQIMEEMEGWEADTDQLLMTLSITGTVFRKTYRDTLNDVNESSLVMPRDLVVNYWTRSLEKASRITQRIKMTDNDIKERVNAGLFLDVELPTPSSEDVDDSKHEARRLTVGDDDPLVTPHLILEQHTWLDLDEDGYKEPYIVTVEKTSQKVLRIVARFSQEDVSVTDDGKVSRIKPRQYFTKYGFIPNPDGGFYDLGFGILLGALNESANTIVNQLIDAGTLSNLQSGFLAKGLRVKLGNTSFTPGEWKTVNATSDDIRKGILPMPVREPSQVLFQLLGMIVQSSKELASVAEIFVGKMPGQNTPATTTQSTIEQGMKVFTSIFKRVYRSLTEEFRKLYKLNREYIDPAKYMEVMGNDPATAQDYSGPEKDIVPAADPQAQTDSMKQQKAQAILQVAQLGGLDAQAAVFRFLEANGVEDIQQLMPKPQPPPPPPPEVQKAQMEMQQAQQMHQMKMEELKLSVEVKKQMAIVDQQMKQMELQIKQAELKLEEALIALKAKEAHISVVTASEKSRIALETQRSKAKSREG